jgi:hypothetical protein
MTEPLHDQEQPDRGPSRVSIWRTAKGDPRWKITVRVGEEDADLYQALALAVAADRRLAGELGVSPAFEGEEPRAA